MTTRVITAVIAIAMVSTLVLPNRATPKAIDAVFQLVSGPLSVAMGST